MRFGGAHGEVAGVGAGNLDNKKDEEKERAREPVGGEEQTGQNPLGLRGGWLGGKGGGDDPSMESGEET